LRCHWGAGRPSSWGQRAAANARGWRWEEEHRAAPGGGAGAEGVERGRENVGEREGGAVAAEGDATAAER